MALNKNDLKQIRAVVKEELDDQFDNQKEVILEEIDGKLTNLRSDLFEKIDPILTEVTTAREERPLIENRIEALEDIHPEGKHILAS